MVDGCSFKITPQGSGYIISSNDGTGYLTANGTSNGTQFYMTNNQGNAMVFTFPSAN